MIKSGSLRWAGHVARIEEGRDAYKILTGISTGKRFPGRFRHMWEGNIRIDLKEVDVNTRNSINSVQNKDYWRDFVNAVLNLQVQ